MLPKKQKPKPFRVEVEIVHPDATSTWLPVQRFRSKPDLVKLLKRAIREHGKAHPHSVIQVHAEGKNLPRKVYAVAEPPHRGHSA